MARELSRAQKIEASISSKFRKYLWAPFLTAINQYELIQPDDRILVCISGGKDSMLLAKLLQMLQRYSDIPFELEFIIMDPGYLPANRAKIEENLKILDIPAEIVETDIFRVVDHMERKACYMCARMRRGHLYHFAEERKCNKIALGHHLNDVIETALMSMMWSSKLETMVPKSRSRNFGHMELIRPLYRVKEYDINRWCKYNDLSFIQCACRFTERSENGEIESKRKETKELIAQLKKTNPEIEHNMMEAMHRVQVHTFPAYKLGDTTHTFLENYEGVEEDE